MAAFNPLNTLSPPANVVVTPRIKKNGKKEAAYVTAVRTIRAAGYYGPVGGYCAPQPKYVGEIVKTMEEALSHCARCRALVMCPKGAPIDPRTKEPLRILMHPSKIENMRAQTLRSHIQHGLFRFYNKPKKNGNS